MPRRQLPSLNALLAFEAVGRLGRMTRAAEELGVTHGAVSRQVAHLEAVLGVALLEGPKNRLTLTQAGREPGKHGLHGSAGAAATWLEPNTSTSTICLRRRRRGSASVSRHGLSSLTM